MVYVFNNLKYDTDKMDCISTKCMHAFNIFDCPVNVKLYKSLKGRWLIVFKQGGALAIDEELNNMIIYYGIEFYVHDNERQFTAYHIVFKNKTIEENITRTQRCGMPDIISGIIPIPCRIVDENNIKKLICDAVARFRAEELGRYD